MNDIELIKILALSINIQGEYKEREKEGIHYSDSDGDKVFNPLTNISDCDKVIESNKVICCFDSTSKIAFAFPMSSIGNSKSDRFSKVVSSKVENLNPLDIEKTLRRVSLLCAASEFSSEN